MGTKWKGKEEMPRGVRDDEGREEKMEGGNEGEKYGRREGVGGERRDEKRRSKR